MAKDTGKDTQYLKMHRKFEKEWVDKDKIEKPKITIRPRIIFNGYNDYGFDDDNFLLTKTNEGRIYGHELRRFIKNEHINTQNVIGNFVDDESLKLKTLISEENLDDRKWTREETDRAVVEINTHTTTEVNDAETKILTKISSSETNIVNKIENSKNEINSILNTILSKIGNPVSNIIKSLS